MNTTTRTVLRLMRLRRAGVYAIECTYCHTWVRPRRIALPAIVCRTCEKAGHNQTWKPPAARVRAVRLTAATGTRADHILGGK